MENANHVPTQDELIEICNQKRSKKVYAFIEDGYLYCTNDPSTVDGGLPDAYMVFNNFDTFENFIDTTEIPGVDAIVEL